MEEPKGSLIIIGGHEDREDEKKILREVAKYVNGGKLVIATVASQEPDENWKTYREAFHDLGVENVVHLKIDSRAEAMQPDKAEIVRGAKGVFFTGGDQLRITSEFGGTPACEEIHNIYFEGGLLAGTSAGASVMSNTMLVGGESEVSVKVKESITLAPGLGFLTDVIVDQHFAERGRISRLIGAVAQNPKMLGVGIDEDTAIVLEKPGCFRVLGAGAVYVVDAKGSTASNVAEGTAECVLAIHNVKLHVLNDGERFSIYDRRPLKMNQRNGHPPDEKEQRLRRTSIHAARPPH